MYENCLRKFYKHFNIEAMLYLARAYYKMGKLQECKQVLIKVKNFAQIAVIIVLGIAKFLESLMKYYIMLSVNLFSVKTG